MTTEELIERLRAQANPDNVAGMARYGISAVNTLGVSAPVLRALAREAGRDHALAARLWSSGIHEARSLATLIDDPRHITRAQIGRWIKDVDSWDLCDALTHNLVRYAPFAFALAVKWSGARAEFQRRAAFGLMAGLAVKAKAPDSAFEAFLPLIVTASTDERNMVKKAVNWALRQIGKRNAVLNQKAIATAERIRRLDSPAARWIAADALRELRARTAGLRHKGGAA